MKKISLRLTNHQLHWLHSQAERESLSCSEYVRDLLRVQMERPDFLDYFKIGRHKTAVKSETEKKIIRYSIMAYKLLEKLVLTETNGEKIKEEAYLNTLALLSTLKIHPDGSKKQGLTILLDPEQIGWLEERARWLSKRTVHVLRRIIVLMMQEAVDQPTQSLDPAEQEGIRYVIITCKLVEQYLMQVFEGGDTLIKTAYQQSEAIYKAIVSAK
jgi:hypothetical protein